MEDLKNFLYQLTDLAILFLRLIMGIMFIISGYGKTKNVTAFADKNDISRIMGYIVVFTEISAGISIVLGIFPRIGAVMIMGLMIGTTWKHVVQWKSPYWASKGGWEYDLIWFLTAFLVLTTGGGSLVIITL